MGLKGLSSRTDSWTEAAGHTPRAYVLGLNVTAHALFDHRAKVTVRTAEEFIWTQTQLCIDKIIQLCKD
jgi:hypothetical protein